MTVNTIIKNIKGKPPLSFRSPKSTMGLIGGTPIVEITKVDTGKCKLYCKLEQYNPGGSIKDRIALGMIRDAIEQGNIKSGDTIVEATAGNTGLGLAIVSRIFNLHLIVVITERVSREKICALKGFGAEVVVADSLASPDSEAYYEKVAKALATSGNADFYIDQFNNPANSFSHQITTGPEIWEQLGGNIDAFVAGVGSGGTVTGVGRFLKGKRGDIDIIVADTSASYIADAVDRCVYPKTESFLEGAGNKYVPAVCDLDYIDSVKRVTDSEALETCSMILSMEGLFLGPTSGLILNAAIKYCREQVSQKSVVAISPDGGDRYMSKLFGR